MKKTVFAAASLIVLFLTAMPIEAAPAKTDPAKILAALNSKTAKIASDWESVNKISGASTRELEVYSYVFSIEKGGVLQIKFEETIKNFINKQHTATDSVVGTVSFAPDQIDQKKTGINNSRIEISCQDQTKCMTRETHSLDYRAKNEKTTEKDRKNPAGKFVIRGTAGRPLADQISKDLKDLFTALAPPAKPAEKPVTEATGKK